MAGRNSTVKLESLTPEMETGEALLTSPSPTKLSGSLPGVCAPSGDSVFLSERAQFPRKSEPEVDTID